MKKFTLIIASLFIFGCTSVPKEANTHTIGNVKDSVILECQATVEQLKADIVEKDKKITWLRKKAKDAGADLSK